MPVVDIPILAISQGTQRVIFSIRDVRFVKANREFIAVNTSETSTPQGFYKSSGLNSGFPNTWFPFYGINTVEPKPQKPLGYIYKHSKFDLKEDPELRIFKELNQEELEKIKGIYDECMLKYRHTDEDKNENYEAFLQRFSNLNNMLISLKIGEGLWEDPTFTKLRENFVEQYSEILEQLPDYRINRQCPSLIHTQDRNISTLNELNHKLETLHAKLHESLAFRDYTSSCGLKK